MYRVILFFLAIQLSFGDAADKFGDASPPPPADQLHATPAHPHPHASTAKIDDVSKPLILGALAKIDRTQFIETIFNAIASYLSNGYYFYPNQPGLADRLPSDMVSEIINIHRALIAASTPVGSPVPAENTEAYTAISCLTQVILAWGPRRQFA